MTKIVYILHFLSIVVIPSFAQTNGIRLPVEKTCTIKGIETKIKFLKIEMTPKGAFTDVIIGFQNPETKEWIFFDALEVPFQKEGFRGSFQLKLRDQFEGRDIRFIKDILEIRNGKEFFWKCGCNESLPGMPI